MADLRTDGFTILRGAFSLPEVSALIAGWESACRESSDTILRAGETPYGARHVLDVWPGAADAAKAAPLREAVCDVLGKGAGLVRVLFFDKPPGNSWALPWHKDLTIAVREHVGGEVFAKPTVKAGVPHVEASLEFLQRMLTARVHLDDADAENGALRVLVGSHHTGKALKHEGLAEELIEVSAGDVLLMQPLLAHASSNSREGTERHRRVLHLEFAADAELLGGYEWHTFRALNEPGS